MREVLFFSEKSVQLVLFCQKASTYLDIFPMQIWNEKQKQVHAIAQEKKDRNLSRKFNELAHAFVLEEDGNGRLLIPQRFIQFLQPNSELTFIGNFEKIELWNSSALQSEETETVLSQGEKDLIFGF